MEEQTIYLQEILLNLSEENFESTLEFLKNSIYIKIKSNLFLLVHNFFIAATCRPKNMMILSHLLFELYSSSINKENALKFLPQAIHDETKYNLYPPFYFYYCLMKSGFPVDLIISSLVDQFESSLRKSLINQNLKFFKDDQIFYGYALFAPELIEANKFEWFNYIMQYYNDNQYNIEDQSKTHEKNSKNKNSFNNDIKLSKNVKLFIKKFPKLCEKNFKKYKELRDIGWNPDERYVAIQKDDDKELDQILQEEGGESIEKIVNKPINWSVFERCQFLQNKPLPIHVAAFFNSTKCLAYLISHGADLKATDSCGRTVTQFSIAGGWNDMRIFDRNKCSFEGVLHIAAKFHQYHIFEAIKGSLQNNNKTTNNRQKNTNSSQTTGDTSDIESDSTQTTKRGKKTEIQTRSGSNPKLTKKPKPESKPKASSKAKPSTLVAGISNSISINGPQEFLTNNIKGLGTILHQAALSNCVKILTMFLNKSDQNVADDNDSECEFNLNEFVNLQANQEKVSKNKQCYSSYLKNDTPLIVAIKSYNIEALNFLISLPSIDINEKNAILLKSPLHVAAKRGYENILKVLLDHPNIDFNPTDIIGRTPVFEATYYLQYKILKILSDFDEVDFNVKDKYGKKPYEIELVMPVNAISDINYGNMIRLLRKFSR